MTDTGKRMLELAATFDATARISTFNGGMTVEGEAAIARMHLLSLLGAISLEVVGMKRRGNSAQSIAKRTYGVRGRTARDVFRAFRSLLAERGICEADAYDNVIV